MAAKVPAGLFTFGVINVIVAFIPPCSGWLGASFYFDKTAPMFVEGRDVRQRFNKHLEREAPMAAPVAIIAAIMNCFVVLPLIAGAVGLFMVQNWGRWLTIGAAGLMVLTFLFHDVYLLAVLRPAVARFVEPLAPRGPQGEGFQVGFSMGFVAWGCFNPFIILYLIGMSIYLLLTDAFVGRVERKKRRRSQRDDDADDEDDDEEDDERRRRRRRRDRDRNEED